MTKINYTFKYSKKTIALKLTPQQVQLLRFIGIFGFVTTAQLNLLWSAIVKYPTSLSPSILSKWCGYNSLCNMVPISAKRKNKKLKMLHTTITLTNQARKWLADINVLPYSYDYSAINSHNEQAIETIVQSIYTATFSKSTLASYLPYITDTDDHYFYCAKALRGAQLKGIRESASQNGVTGANHSDVSKGASQKVQIHISQFSTNTTNTNKLLRLISLSNTNRVINYIGCLSPKLQELLTDGGNPELEQLLNCYTINIANSLSTLSINIVPSRGCLSPKSSTATTNSKTNNVTNIKDVRFHNEGSNLGVKPNYLRKLFYQHLPIFQQLLQLKLAICFPILTFLNSTKQLVFKKNADSYSIVIPQLSHNYPTVIPHLKLASALSGKWLYSLWYKDSELAKQRLTSSLGGSNNIKLSHRYPTVIPQLSHSYSILLEELECINELYPNLLYNLTSNTGSTTKRDAYIASRPKQEKNYRLQKIVKRKKKQDSYSHNLFNQQLSLIGILNGNNPDDKKDSHVKHENQNKKHLKKRTKHLAFAYYYPNQLIRVEAYTTDNICLPKKLNSIDQLNAEQQNLLIILAYCNILIDRWYQSTHSTADFDAKWHLPVQDKLKYPLQDAPVQRGIDLISNPSFDINNYDFRSFNQQFGYTFAESKNLPFVADEMIFFTRNQRKHETFLELDNRTESNQTQVQKIMNYIWYALKHQEKEISMIIAITDGSLKSRKVPNYTNLGRKVGNMTSLFLRTYLNTDQSKRVYLGALYRQAKNLHIYITGVSEAHLDIASILLGSNYLADQLVTVRQLSSELAKHTRWNVTYTASKKVSKLLQTPELLFNTGNQSFESILHPSTRNEYDNYNLGTLRFTDKISGEIIKQLLIPAQEHELGAVINTYNLLNQRSTKLGRETPTPLLIYPHRVRTATAIVLPQYTKQYAYNSGYTPVMPYLIQPLYGDNLPSHEQLRWLTIQYAKAIQSYFLIGAVNQATLKKDISYGDARVNLLNNNFSARPRPYHELRSLAKEMRPINFVNQLCLNEIPLGLYKFLMTERWPQGAYYVPRYIDLLYLTEHKFKKFFFSPQNETLQAYGLDKLDPSTRSQMRL